MKLLFVLIISVLTALPVFAKDEWKTFPIMFPIYSAIPFNDDGVFLATRGGIRYRSPGAELLFTSSDGLETSSFRSLENTPYGLIAISEYGLIAKAKSDFSGWTVLNRSFIGRGVSVLPGMTASAGRVLAIGFENCISFFDILSNTYSLTISRIGSVSLVSNPVTAMSIHGDSLYIAVGKNLFSRKMNWFDLAGDSRLGDPESWHVVKHPVEIHGIAWKGDSLKVFPVEGTWSWNGNELSSATVDTSKIVLNGKKLNDPSLYTEVRYDSTYKRDVQDSKIHWIFPKDNGTAILVGSQDVIYYDGKNYLNLTDNAASLVGEVYELVPLSQGGVLAASLDNRIAYNNGNFWGTPFEAWPNGLTNKVEAYAKGMKVLSATSDGFVLYHVWGMGFMLYQAWGAIPAYSMFPGNGLCMDEFLDVPYTITVSTIVAPDESGFLTATFSKDGGYGLVYISRSGEMSCIHNAGSTRLAGVMKARMDEESSDWIVYVGVRDEMNPSSTGKLDVFRISPPAKNGGRMMSLSKKTYMGPNGFVPIDMAIDEKNSVLWMVTVSDIGYFEFNQDTVRIPDSMNGLSGVDYSAIDVDVHGNVWVGTTNRGAYRLSRKKTSFDTLSVKHFTSNMGLLSNNVSDVAIDSVLGMAWFSHEQGVTRYTRNDLRKASSYMTDSATVDVIAYPNPFRPKQHKMMVFDHIAEDATVSIFNRGGSLVQFFSHNDLLGGKVEWDGTGKNGKLVAPGVYYYIVKTSSKKEKGKILVIH